MKTIQPLLHYQLYLSFALWLCTASLSSATQSLSVWQSTDGLAWSHQSAGESGTPFHPAAMAYANGIYVVAGYPGILTSSDGASWSEVPDIDGFFSSVIHGDSRFVAVGAAGRILTSIDGLAWAEADSTTHQHWTSIAYGNGKFVAVGSNGVVGVSTNGTTWTLGTSGATRCLFSVVWTGTQFVTVGESGAVRSSPDGVTWTFNFSGLSENLVAIAYGNNQYVLLAAEGTAMYNSSSLGQWQASTIPVNAAPTCILYSTVGGAGNFYAFGHGQILASTNGKNWTSKLSEGAGNFATAVATSTSIRAIESFPVIQFSAPASPTALVLSEINYHPLDSSPSTAFIELYNPSNQVLPMEGYVLEGDVSYAFPQGALLAPWSYAVLVEDTNAFQARYPGVETAGLYEGTLSEPSGLVRLGSPFGSLVANVPYNTEARWPFSTRGWGATLVFDNTSGHYNSPLGWMASRAPGGSPGGAEPGDAIPLAEKVFHYPLNKGSGVYWNDWFDTFYIPEYPWVFHFEHGWQCMFGESSESIWAYDLQLGWLWISDANYPFVFSPDAQIDSWLFYWKGSGLKSERWFYNFKKGEWLSVVKPS
ncbi:MAG: lamin tail domain-containing protein [Verrucomicrobiota bacterium]|nr:lamin tail domain-containing protein [Verrucomicrobiota bacterium]